MSNLWSYKRIARAVQILQAIDEYFAEGKKHGTYHPLYPGALLFEDETTIAEAIENCLKS